MQWKKEKEELVKFAKKIYKKGFVSGLSGNLSLRVNEKAFLITPKAKYYEKLKNSDLVLVDLDGNIIEGEKEPSSEKKLHLAIYRERKDINAIIHAHSCFACILAALECPLPIILDEQREVLGGEVKVAKYAPSGSDELAHETVRCLGQGKAVILAKHGTVATGKSITEAYYVCELLERLSKIYLFMRLLQR